MLQYTFEIHEYKIICTSGHNKWRKLPMGTGHAMLINVHLDREQKHVGINL